MIEQHMVRLPQLTEGKKPRRVYVYVPDEAEEDTEARYPVLYMFDGHNVFYDEDATYGKSWGLGEYLSENHVPLMVVAVECSHTRNNGRLSEYSPWSFCEDGIGRVFGRGRKTMDWYARDLKQFIDRKYPTLPGRETTFIAGSSMGGLMSLYAVLAYNHVYSRAAALSPSLWIYPERIQRLVSRSHPTEDTVLYMDYGSREAGNHNNTLSGIMRTAADLVDKGVKVTCRIVPNGDHCEACWEEQIPFFINTLLYQRD